MDSVHDKLYFILLCHSFSSRLGAIQKIRVKLGGTEGSSHLTQIDTRGEEGVHQFNTCQFYLLLIFTYLG
jgi:hypothetical protein